jgi:hypothetical protein
MQTGVQDSYAPRAALEAGVLDAVHQANVAFLKLVARRSAGGTSEAIGLSAELAARVARLDERARRLVGQCAYTLFNLRFEDAEFWRRVAAEAAEDRGADREAVADAAPSEPARAPLDETAFALKAVVLAWHVARQGDLATLLFGMSPAVQEAWRGLALAALDRAAVAALPHLRVRWGRARFWPQLLDAAQPADPEALEKVRLLGLQLLATDGFRAQPARPPAVRFAGVAIATVPMRTRRT